MKIYSGLQQEVGDQPACAGARLGCEPDKLTAVHLIDVIAVPNDGIWPR
jgi:hypothetical protein